VGAFLSGGIDSTLVVGAAAAASPEPLQTCSIGFEESAFNELPFARAAAARFHTQHVDQVATPDAALALDRLSHFFDEPFADPSMIPTSLVSRLARTRVKVALSGDGGDEAFGGYPRYAKQLRERQVRAWLPGWAPEAIRPLGVRWPHLPLFANLALDAADAYANATTTCRLPLRRQLLSGDVISALNGFVPGSPLVEAQRRVDATDPVAGMIAADLAVRLPDRYLVKVDRASMAEGLEVRPPFLDHELLELSARVPSSLKVHRGETKWILKRAGREWLDPSDSDRPKQGFDMPTAAWLRGPLRAMFEERVLRSGSPIADLVDRHAVAEALQTHVAGRRDHRHPLWALLVLASWAARYR
jgi:asparagine synthase (glutamine-hydrolysing)